MENLLRLLERVEIAVELGESYYREFKSGYEGAPGNKKPRDFKDICHNVAKELVAFANADGGELFIGIEDNGDVTGLPHTNEKLDAILSAPENYVLKDTPLPIKRKNIIQYHDKKIIYFSVDKGSRQAEESVSSEKIGTVCRQPQITYVLLGKKSHQGNTTANLKTWPQSLT
jgi:ATP-dependent DNA helicase RecG